jgi:gamma-glutamyltranspeptidase / glutathione hydrolase
VSAELDALRLDGEPSGAVAGAVAAGHPRTAAAGARALMEGGNAVDACVAAGFVSWVVESPLTGPGAGGFMLVHRARDRSDRLLDFFVAVPGRGLPPDAAAEQDFVDIAFAPEYVARYGVGAASCGVPGTVAGLADAHRLYGRLPWTEVVAPAIEVARAGLEVSTAQAVLHAVLDPVLRWGAEARRIYGGERPLRAGDRLLADDLADTLELLAVEGADAFYRGDLARTISACVREQGGLITQEDLAAYRVVRRTPTRAPFRGHEFVSNPPPSSGGVLIALALRLFERLGPPDAPGSSAAVVRLAEVMREATRARGGAFVRDLHRGGLAGRLLADGYVEEAVARIRARVRGPAGEPVALPSTTHVSAVDQAGNAASLSASTGTGSGVVVAGTGIHLNNMLGEEDLRESLARAPRGQRLTSMMAPSLVLRDGRPRLVVGSAGSARLRGAILQIVVNVLDHGMPVEQAIGMPRVHLDERGLQLEGGIDGAVADELEALGYPVVRWEGLNLFYGGAAVVALGEDGRLEAAGDPRRGGAGVVVA